MHRPFFCSSYHFRRGFASLFWVKKGAGRVREGCREGHVRAAGNGDFSGEFPGAFSLRKLVNAPVFFSEYCWGKFLVDAVFFADDFGFGGVLRRVDQFGGNGYRESELGRWEICPGGGRMVSLGEFLGCSFRRGSVPRGRILLRGKWQRTFRWADLLTNSEGP